MFKPIDKDNMKKKVNIKTKDNKLNEDSPRMEKMCNDTSAAIPEVSASNKTSQKSPGKVNKYSDSHSSQVELKESPCNTMSTNNLNNFTFLNPHKTKLDLAINPEISNKTFTKEFKA